MIDEPSKEFILLDEEAKQLYDFLMKDGYISCEFHPLVVELVRKLDKYLEQKK